MRRFLPLFALVLLLVVAGCGSQRATAPPSTLSTLPSASITSTTPTPSAPAPSAPSPTTSTPTPQPRPTQSKPKPRPSGYPVVTLTRSIAIRARIGGPVVRNIPAITEYNTRRRLPVLAQHGTWLKVPVTEIVNRPVWISVRSRGLKMGREPYRVIVHRDQHRLLVEAGRKIVKNFIVGIGSPSTPTPIGTYALTDRLPGPEFGPYYGNWILALSGHQTHLPPGWPGGDRLAIHGTDDPATIGASLSTGCVHANTADIDWLHRHLPIGTAVTVED